MLAYSAPFGADSRGPISIKITGWGGRSEHHSALRPQHPWYVAREIRGGPTG